MGVQLVIRNLPDGLLFRVEHPTKSTLFRLAVAVSATSAAVFLVAWRYLQWPVALALAGLLAAAEVLSIARAKVAELKVTNLEFTSLARIEGRFGRRRSLSRTDIRWLEYQEDTTGPETAHHPGGLYAVVRHGSVCLLPDTDESQTALIIERICEHFPDFRKQCAEQSPFEHFTQLHLDQSSSPSS